MLTSHYHLENFIGGYFIGPLSSRFIDNVNPATGQVYGQVPDSNEKDVDLAVQEAEKAFPAWSVTPVEKICHPQPHSWTDRPSFTSIGIGGNQW